MLFNTIFVFQVLLALVVIVLVLLQHGKGADMGAAFGSGASGSLFGVTGSSNFLSKLTSFTATAFFITTLMLVQLGKNHSIVFDSTIRDKSAGISAIYKDISITQKISAKTISDKLSDSTLY
jgi:preprotein translocase subunit SecG